MTTVVSDTSPINYLVLIEAIEVLPSIFSEILMPPAVLKELQHVATPAVVSRWACQLPDWVKIQAPRIVDLRIGLGAGETEGISLAVERNIQVMLIDERKGWEAARQRGLLPIGTINILETADRLGLLDFEDATTRLKETSFRFNQPLLKIITEKVKTRRNLKSD